LSPAGFVYNKLVCVQSAKVAVDDGQAAAMAQLEKNIMLRKAQLYDMEESLPKSNSTYLKIILGNVNVSILNKDQKYVIFISYFDSFVMHGCDAAMERTQLWNTHKINVNNLTLFLWVFQSCGRLFSMCLLWENHNLF